MTGISGHPPRSSVSSGALAGLNAFYCAAVLASWRRASIVGSLLIGLYALLYFLLSLEAFSLLAVAFLPVIALALTMSWTRWIDCGVPSDRAADA